MLIEQTNDYGAVTGWKVTRDSGEVVNLVTWKDVHGRTAVAEDANTVTFFKYPPEEAIKRYMNPAVRPVKGE